MKKSCVILLLVSISLLLFSQCSIDDRSNEKGILLDKYRKIGLVGSSETVHTTTSSGLNLIWYSSDESVATISDSGEITGISSGSAIIYIETEDGSYKDSCYVRVVTTVLKNIVLCIGDGMGYEQVKAAGIFKNGIEGSLLFESLEYTNGMTTYSADSTITDSAASATAMATR